MSKKSSLSWSVVVTLVASLGLAGGAAAATLGPTYQGLPANGPQMGPSATVSVFASGLNSPRGLKFGPDGYLYVAEGGTGGTQSTVGQCTQVPGVGPYTGGFTSRISKFSPAGVRTTVVDHLASSQTISQTGSLVSGVADVAFIGKTLYAIEAGAGCSHGLAGTDNTLFRVNPDGTTTNVANLSAFLKANPVANPDPDDLEPDGTWFSLVAQDRAFYVTEPNHQEIDRIALNGKITRVTDLSTQFVSPKGWVGATGLAYNKDGEDFYFGTLGAFPVSPTTQSLYRLTEDRQVEAVASGLTMVMGITIDTKGNLYAVEADTVAGMPGPSSAGSGKVVRVSEDGTLTEIAGGLVCPTAITYGPDGKLYVSNFGFGTPPGSGQIVRITPPNN